jgi:hypothetical protein
MEFWMDKICYSLYGRVEPFGMTISTASSWTIHSVVLMLKTNPAITRRGYKACTCMLGSVPVDEEARWRSPTFQRL